MHTGGLWETPAVLMGENKQLFYLNTDVQNLLKGARYSLCVSLMEKAKIFELFSSNLIVKMFWRCVCVLTGFCFIFANHMQTLLFC